MLKSLLTKLAAAKVALATAVAVVATGGAAALATVSPDSGHVNAGQSVASQQASASDDSSDSNQPSDPAESSDSTEPPESSDASEPSSAAPSPSLVGLCHAFQAGAGSHQPRVLENPAFSVLVSAAGGIDNLPSFCTALIGPAPSHPAGRPSSVPSHSHPAGPASGIPSHSHPGGPPSSIPSHSH